MEATILPAVSVAPQAVVVPVASAMGDEAPDFAALLAGLIGAETLAGPDPGTGIEAGAAMPVAMVPAELFVVPLPAAPPSPDLLAVEASAAETGPGIVPPAGAEAVSEAELPGPQPVAAVTLPIPASAGEVIPGDVPAAGRPGVQAAAPVADTLRADQPLATPPATAPSLAPDTQLMAPAAPPLAAAGPGLPEPGGPPVPAPAAMPLPAMASAAPDEVVVSDVLVPSAPQPSAATPTTPETALAPEPTRAGMPPLAVPVLVAPPRADVAPTRPPSVVPAVMAESVAETDAAPTIAAPLPATLLPTPPVAPSPILATPPVEPPPVARDERRIAADPPKPEASAALAAPPGAAPPPAVPEAAPPSTPRPSAPVPWPARQVMPFAVSLALGADDSISLTLEPAELGRVEVAIARGAEAHVTLRAERPETLALLQRDRAELERALAGTGLGAEGRGPSLSFGLGTGSGGEERRDRRPAPRDDAARPAAAPLPAGVIPAAASARGLIDLAF